MGFRSIPGDSPLAAVFLIVAIGWVLGARVVAGIEPSRATRAGRARRWWQRQARPARSKLSIGAVLVVFGTLALVTLQQAGVDPASGQVLIALLALVLGLVQIAAGVRAVSRPE